MLEREAGRATEQVIAALPTDFATRSPDDAFADAVRVFVNTVVEAQARWRLVLTDPEKFTPDRLVAFVTRIAHGLLGRA